MKRWFAFGCAILCVLSLVLAGCSTRLRGDTEGADAHGAEGEHAKELEETLIRQWHLSRTQKDGLTVWTDGDLGFSLFVKEDGDASFSHLNTGFMSSDKAFMALRWSATSFDDITFYSEEWDKEYSGRKNRSVKVYTAFSAVYHPDKKELWVDANEWGVDATFCFSEDFTMEYSHYKEEYNVETSKIEDASAIIGDWTLVNVVDDTSVIAGEGDEIAKWQSYKAGTMTLSAGGKGTFLGEGVEWSVTDGVGKMSVLSGNQILTFEKTPNGIMVKGEVANYTFEPVKA